MCHCSSTYSPAIITTRVPQPTSYQTNYVSSTTSRSSDSAAVTVTPKSFAVPTSSSNAPMTTTGSPASVYKQRMKEYFKKNPEKFRQYYQQLQAYHSSKKTLETTPPQVATRRIQVDEFLPTVSTEPPTTVTARTTTSTSSIPPSEPTTTIQDLLMESSTLRSQLKEKLSALAKSKGRTTCLITIFGHNCSRQNCLSRYLICYHFFIKIWVFRIIAQIDFN